MSPDPNPAFFAALVGAAILVVALIGAIFSSGGVEEGKPELEVTPEELDLVREVRELRRRNAIERNRR